MIVGFKFNFGEYILRLDLDKGLCTCKKYLGNESRPFQITYSAGIHGYIITVDGYIRGSGLRHRYVTYMDYHRRRGFLSPDEKFLHIYTSSNALYDDETPVSIETFRSLITMKELVS